MTGDEGDGPGVQTIRNHPFEPEDEWWTRCRLCGLAEAAHAITTTGPMYDEPARVIGGES